MNRNDSGTANHDHFHVQRLPGNPIISPGLFAAAGIAEQGTNINGPSLIRVPLWVANPLGRYYLYFAHHQGHYLRLAYADQLDGRWTLYPRGVLHRDQGPGRDHIASPDVIVDHEQKQIRLYFHQMARDADSSARQVSYVALSEDGLNFSARPEVLGSYYFRVFAHRGYYYALAKHGNIDGVLLRSKNGLTSFQQGPHFLPGVRHTAVWVEDDLLYVLYTMVGQAPERIYLTTVDITSDWRQWRIAPGPSLLEPKTDYEGGDLPLVLSTYGSLDTPARQLRDPAYFQEDGKRYLLYCVAGEQGIALAQLHRATR